MRIAYLDCFAGISGDMFLGALVDAGVPVKVLEDATSALGLGASLRMETVDRSGISCKKVYVMEGERLAEGDVETPMPGTDQTSSLPSWNAEHLHTAGHSHTAGDSHTAGHSHPRVLAPQAVDESEEDVPHTHGRSLTEIRELIQRASLEAAVKAMAIQAFELLGHSEAKIHNVDVEEIHFHEVGAVDSIVDIVAASAGIHHLKVDAWYCSPVNVGGGMVVCAHGTFPVPAPATADLLRGCPTYSAHVRKELVTPTGAALLKTLAPAFEQQPMMRVDAIGYGAGSRNPQGFPNALRISIGEMEERSAAMTGRSQDTVTVLETALDDLSPQIIAWASEAALSAGALDVMLTPIVMKKGRPGTLLTVLCAPEHSDAMERLIFRETSTLGIRVRQDRRSILGRRHVAVPTAYGVVRVKIGTLGEEEMNVAPEFEDCRAAAVQHGVALKEVQHAAIAAYRTAKAAEGVSRG